MCTRSTHMLRCFAWDAFASVSAEHFLCSLSCAVRTAQPMCVYVPCHVMPCHAMQNVHGNQSKSNCNVFNTARRWIKWWHAHYVTQSKQSPESTHHIKSLKIASRCNVIVVYRLLSTILYLCVCARMCVCVSVSVSFCFHSTYIRNSLFEVTEFSRKCHGIDVGGSGSGG